MTLSPNDSIEFCKSIKQVYATHGVRSTGQAQCQQNEDCPLPGVRQLDDSVSPREPGEGRKRVGRRLEEQVGKRTWSRWLVGVSLDPDICVRPKGLT